MNLRTLAAVGARLAGTLVDKTLARPGQLEDLLQLTADDERAVKRMLDESPPPEPDTGEADTDRG